MNTMLLRLVLVGALVVGLLGATVIAGADVYETTSGDEEPEVMSQMNSHMGDHVPGDHHDDDHADHHANHTGQHSEHHADHADHHAEHHQDGGHC